MLLKKMLLFHRAIPIGYLHFELVSKDSNIPLPPHIDHSQHLQSSLLHLSDPEDEITGTDIEEEPNFIKVKVAGVDWPSGFTNITPISDPTGREGKLPIPENPPDPNSMYIFVNFQVSFCVDLLVFVSVCVCVRVYVCIKSVQSIEKNMISDKFSDLLENRRNYYLPSNLCAFRHKSS